MADKKETVKKSKKTPAEKTDLKMRINSSKSFAGVTVRDASGVAIGWIKDGETVTLLEKPQAERTRVKGKAADGNLITGTVLTQCLK